MRTGGHISQTMKKLKSKIFYFPATKWPFFKGISLLFD
ncbi:hypothetical protein AB434_1465 [Heyndrickxia coagulans]|uniref:Uncharacterized protein n=1 Tax=Heyndrickxia coagulans TaxID=1398 RepID=A0AAN0T9Y7_HEYCO|nr:hypothetical protein SB48_HM08orf06170 [Heyndrickxia coagulans]AKN53870.1 hypothetical protein AB434_1465 [Heyndrickxia coagulans]